MLLQPPKLLMATSLAILAGLWLALGFTSLARATDKPLVVFANPGGRDDAFFQPMTDFMQAAADDLGFKLEIFYGDRNHVLYDQNIQTIFERDQLPDYLIGLDARGVGVHLMAMAEAHGVKTIIINQGFLGQTREMLGFPGEKCKHWLFEFLPDDIQAGRILAQDLIDEAKAKGLTDKHGVVNMVAISGHPKSVAAILREKGMIVAVQENTGVRLLQMTRANWEKERAVKLGQGLLDRYPQATVIWAASDLMGSGAVEAIRQSGKTPGQDILVGGVDWAECGLELVRSGEFVTTVGGHFMDGAWALVMLYDAIHGVDIPKSSQSQFSLLTRDNIDAYLKHFASRRWEDIDFKRFSKYLNPEIKKYPFNIKGVLQQFSTE